MSYPRAYFDHNATTPIAETVIAGMMDVLRDGFGNASSIHQEGQRARHLVEHARREVARLLHADPKEIVFTSGGTEADNTAIFGAMEASASPRRHFVTTTIEHPAVLHAADRLEQLGVEVTRVGVDASGVVDPQSIRAALRPETVLVSVMHANNETGVIQPVAEISSLCHENRVLFHTDAVQSVGKMKVDVRALDVDFLSLSGHKFFGPKGVGVLFMRKGVACNPLLHGGKHERGRRPGTENVPGIHGLGIAASFAHTALQTEPERIGKLRNELEAALMDSIPNVFINCGGSPRLANTSSVCFPGIEGEPLVIALDLRGFAVSSGAACSSGSVEPSHVLTAIGLSRQDARSCLRISLGPSNTVEQVKELVGALRDATSHLRRLAPTASSPVPV
ncbi:MAG: cysteine desulfurase [Bryobacterales bacterium]|nr:cysteine desulfurase [Bryobacterales bacterium]